MPWWDKCLNVTGDYGEVRCIPSSTHVPCIHQRQPQHQCVRYPQWGGYCIKSKASSASHHPHHYPTEFTPQINPSLVPNWVVDGKMKQIRTEALATDCPIVPKQYQNLQPHTFNSFKMKDNHFFAKKLHDTLCTSSLKSSPYQPLDQCPATALLTSLLVTFGERVSRP